MTKRVYLAGPEVFLTNAREIGARKRVICERHGLVGVFPPTKWMPVTRLCRLLIRVSPSAAPWNASCGAVTP